MNKKDLAKKIAKKTVFNQKEATEAIEAVFDAIVESVMDGEEVAIVGFGKFFPYQHSPRPVRNPKTQETMTLDAYMTLRFKLSSVLRDRLKE